MVWAAPQEKKANAGVGTFGPPRVCWPLPKHPYWRVVPLRAWGLFLWAHRGLGLETLARVTISDPIGLYLTPATASGCSNVQGFQGNIRI